MDQVLAPIQDLLEGQIDFHGQQLAETLCTSLLSITGVLAFLVGYIARDIFLTLWVGLAGTLVTFLVVVPPWPTFNKNPERWLPVGGGFAGGITVEDKGLN